MSDRIARAFNKFGATRAVALDISAEPGMLVFFTNLVLMEFQVRYMALFFHFSNRQFQVVLDGSLYKNIQLVLEFLEGQFLVLHFSYYMLMIFLMMLSVIMLSILMILPSALNVIMHLTCGNN